MSSELSWDERQQLIIIDEEQKQNLLSISRVSDGSQLMGEINNSKMSIKSPRYNARFTNTTVMSHE